MITKIIAYIKNNKTKNDLNFFEMPAGAQKKIIDKAVRDANKEQLDLVRRYDEKFKSFKIDKCKI